MNQVFSFKRFFWLMKRQWVENSGIYKNGILLLLVLIPGIQLFFGYFSVKAAPVNLMAFYIYPDARLLARSLF